MTQIEAEQAAAEVRLTRDGDGGYTACDGRFTIRPTTIGDGVTGWAGGRGWSNGHREWHVTDTTGKARLSRHGGPSTICGRLYEVRGLLAAVITREAAEVTR